MRDTNFRKPRLAVDNEAKDSEVPGNEEKFPLLRAAILPDHQILPRQWLYGHHLVRGFVSLLVAPGGTGKSSLAIGICMACMTGRRLLGQHVHQRCNTALLNLEDPQDEIDRRVTAFSKFHGITNADIEGRWFMSPAEQRVLMAAEDEDGFEVIHPDEKRITECLRDNHIDIACVDPFAESHQVPENSPPHMVRAAAAWRRVARSAKCAILLTHHVRKGPVDSIDAARGAKALTDSARIGLLLATMNEVEAEALGIEGHERLQYVRLDDAKANLAPRAGEAQWFHLNHVRLNNATPQYPHGDDVVVIEAWKPPDNALKTAPTSELNTALDAIKAGPEPGILYTRSARGGSGRWCGHVLCDAFQVTTKEAAQMIAKWFKSGLLFETEYFHPKWRRTTKGVDVRQHDRPST